VGSDYDAEEQEYLGGILTPNVLSEATAEVNSVLREFAEHSQLEHPVFLSEICPIEVLQRTVELPASPVWVFQRVKVSELTESYQGMMDLYDASEAVRVLVPFSSTEYRAGWLVQRMFGEQEKDLVSMSAEQFQHCFVDQLYAERDRFEFFKARERLVRTLCADKVITPELYVRP